MEVKKVVLVLEGEMKRAEIQSILQLNHRENFVTNYLEPAMKLLLIEQTQPESPNSPQQRYRLTEKGLILKQKLKSQS